MSKFQTLLATLALVAVAQSIWSVSALSQEVTGDCDGVTIASFEPLHVSSQISGELATYTFDITATLENVGNVSLAAGRTAKLTSGDKELKSVDLGNLAVGKQVKLATKATNWSPYTDHGFAVTISSGSTDADSAPASPLAADACKVDLDGTCFAGFQRGAISTSATMPPLASVGEQSRPPTSNGWLNACVR